MPFLTKLDSNAQIKGSRDPLGVQAIWTHLGRRIVSNLTTVSTSLRDFTTTILGYAFVERLEGAASEVEVFLRWEQWAAYCRVHCHKDVVRGIDRVKARLAESTRVTISAARDHQILSNQKTYGLWGLYSMPARASGLLETNAKLTGIARELVEQEYWHRLKPVAGKDAARIAEKLAPENFKLDLDGPHQALVQATAGILGPPKRAPLSQREHRFYSEHLLYRSGVQQQAVVAMPSELKRNLTLTPRVVQSWAERASRRDPDLAEMLEDVRVTESLLAPAVNLFSFLLGENGRSLAEVSAAVGTAWPAGAYKLDLNRLHALRARIQTATGSRPQSDQQWLTAAQALHESDFESLIRALCEINSTVMQQRGGSRWISIEQGKLRVHAFEAARALPSATALTDLWEHSYFLDSLAMMAVTLEA